MHIQRLTPSHAPVFLVNSRYPLVCATPTRSRSMSVHPREYPLCRRHGSSCSQFLDQDSLGDSPWYSLPDHQCRFGVRAATRLTPGLFSTAWTTGYRAGNGAPIIAPRHTRRTDLPVRLAACLTTENRLRGRLPFRVTPALTYHGYAPNATRRTPPEGGERPATEDSTHRLGPVGSLPVREYPPVHPFLDCACRPRLRTRLTRGRRTWPRNPWSSGGRDPHPSLATHVCILTPAKSTARSPGRFAPCRTLSYPARIHAPPRLRWCA